MKNSIIIAALLLSVNAFAQSNDETRRPIVVLTQPKAKTTVQETPSPLIIVDGLALNQTNSEEGQKQLNGIDPNTIEKIDVLKGKEQTAIYGEKGANGVILITTKKAKSKN
jgi:TonB-dependent starch-binding outer membrane protein SusC